MAYTSYSIDTCLPSTLVDDIIQNCEQHKKPVVNSSIKNNQPTNVRNSLNKWVPHGYWFNQWIRMYIDYINEHNYMYDLDPTFDHGDIQYTIYNEGMHYNWHHDSALGEDSTYNNSLMAYDSLNQRPATPIVQQTNKVRKLSFSLLLSTQGEDFTGGHLQFNDYSKLWCPTQKKGTLVVFDSTIRHRVTKVKSGTRKSLVGWVTGPRWR